MGVRRTGDEWLELVTMFEASNESLDRFCAKREIRPKTFKWWRWRLGKAGAAPKAVRPRPKNDAVRLIPVSVVGLAARSDRETSIEISVADITVRVEPGTDTAYVATLVAELRTRC